MNEFHNFTKYLLQESSTIVVEYFRQPLKIERKSDNSPVTIADKKIEERLRKLINQAYPDHGILGEEFGIDPGNSEYQWVLDPIDGTKSFICGTPLFGTLIALLKNNIPILGAIGFPILKQVLVGDNKQTTLNNKTVQIRKCSHLSQSVLLTSDHLSIQKYQNIDTFNNLLKKVSLYRTWGDCYGYYLLVTGFADIMIDPIISVWDSMALIPIIRGAGGVVTDYQGRDATTGQDLIASNPVLQPLIVSLLNPSDIGE